MKVAYKLGVTDKEIEKLCDAVLKALGKGPLDPEQIRQATGNASRGLGEEGKKKRMTTNLPLALGKLQGIGEIRRVPMNGRLDQQRYHYTLWRPNPLSQFKLSREDSFVELARRFFRWIGPATLGEFKSFSGLGVIATNAAIEPLKLESAEKGSDRLMFEDDRERFVAFTPPAKPYDAFVSSPDAISALRRDVKMLLDQKDWDRKCFGEETMLNAGGLSDLPSHAILDRGRLIGLWEYDPRKKSIVWASFGIRDKALSIAVAQTGTYIREQLGDARSFSLDSPKSRAPRIEGIQAMQP